MPNFNKLATILETQLSKTKWLAGDSFTIADIAVAAPMHLHAESKLPLNEYPSLKRWIADVEQQQCWKDTEEPVLVALVPGRVVKGKGKLVRIALCSGLCNMLPSPVH